MTEPHDAERDDELASALLDGEADAAERASADEAVRARMAQFAAVQDAVRAVTPPSEGARRAAIGAALGEWDAARRPATAVTAPPRPARSSSRPAWFLGVAAAAVVAALAGVVVSGGLGGSDDDDSVAIEEAATISAEATEETSLRTESAAELADDQDLAASEAVTEAAPEDGADELEAPAGGALAAETTAAGADAPTGDVVVDLVGPDALVAFAASARAADGPATACDATDLGAVVGLARYAEMAGDVAVDVVVTVDDAARVVRALDAATCDVVAQAPTR
jgi:hypothetical protein